MILNVLSDHFCRYLVAHCAGEVSVFPQFPSPQPSLHLRVLPKYRSRTQALEPTHYLSNRISRRERTEDMHMIRAHFHLFYRNVVLLGYLFKHLADTACNLAFQYILAVLWRPYQMIGSIISGVCCASENHARILPNAGHLAMGHGPPSKDASPTPAASSGALRSFFVKTGKWKRGKPHRLIGDRGYDSNPVRALLVKRGIEPIIPKRKNNQVATHQDGRKMRRYKRRWIIERSNSWLQTFRKLVVRYERSEKIFAALVHMACALITFKRDSGWLLRGSQKS